MLVDHLLRADTTPSLKDLTTVLKSDTTMRLQTEEAMRVVVACTQVVPEKITIMKRTSSREVEAVKQEAVVEETTK
jgi:hypothetical protein